MNKFLSKKILVVMAVFVCTLAGFILWRNSQFRVVSINPNPSGRVATSTTVFEITFNRNLSADQDYSQKIDDPNQIARATTVNQNKLRVEIDRLLNKETYTLTVNDVVSVNNEVIPKVTLRFVADYVPYNDLSEAEKELQKSVVDRDNFTDPIMPHLPHSTLNFYLYAVFEGNNEPHFHLREELGEEVEVDSSVNTQVTLFADLLLSKADVTIDRQAAIDTYKNEVLEYIRSKNVDPNNYRIEYRIVEPSIY